ncbi:hypothetical protein [Streptomyces sp. NPDC002209]|uniref:hypothetical protein n=1 Tax=Streptomyces sp. NPDC002209 TaxID=3364638 RepID=UPI0036BA1B8A
MPLLKVRAASLTDRRLRTRDGREEYGPAATSLEGLLCVTFSPDGPPAPPVIPPFVFMTRVGAERAPLTSDVIVTDGLRLEAS